jgi:hypothetical protein
MSSLLYPKNKNKKYKICILFFTGNSQMQNPGYVIFIFSTLQYGFDNNLHCLRRENTKNSGEF